MAVGWVVCIVNVRQCAASSTCSSIRPGVWGSNLVGNGIGFDIHRIYGWALPGDHQNQGRTVKRGGGVRIVNCLLPVKSPWLNPIEAYWVHGKRRVVEPARLLTAEELAERVCATYGCVHEPHLSIPDKVS